MGIFWTFIAQCWVESNQDIFNRFTIMTGYLSSFHLKYLIAHNNEITFSWKEANWQRIKERETYLIKINVWLFLLLMLNSDKMQLEYSCSCQIVVIMPLCNIATWKSYPQRDEPLNKLFDGYTTVTNQREFSLCTSRYFAIKNFPKSHQISLQLSVAFYHMRLQ